jgi:hypothetical protein
LEPGCRLGPIVCDAQHKRVSSYVQVGRGALGRAGVAGVGVAVGVVVVRHRAFVRAGVVGSHKCPADHPAPPTGVA